MTTTVLFDMDGVLVSSEPHWKRHWRNEVFPEVQEGTPTLDDVTGRNFRESLAMLDETYGLPGGTERFETEATEFAEEMYREEVTVTDGMAELFSLIREAGLSLGIVSSSPPQWISLVLDRSAFGDLDVVVSAEDIEAPGKPNPAVYDHALDTLSADPAESIVVEDSKNGVRAASQAGATVIRYQCDHATEPFSGADYVAENIEALRTHLRQLIDEE